MMARRYSCQRSRGSIRHLIGLAFFLFGALALAACGTFSGSQSHFNTPPATGSASSTASAQSRYAYLYSRIDYPLQIAVNSGDTVSLILSPSSDILTVAPTSGTGTTTFSEPIPLPTDLENYQDIGASVDTLQPSGPGPLVWELTSAPRQSLLTPADGSPRAYRPTVTFQWQVRAVSAGENTTQIEMTLYYVYLDGSEHDGKLQVSQSPIPIVGVSVSGVRKTLPPLRLPIAGLTGLAGALAFLRFFWSAYRTMKDVADSGRDAAKVARTIQRRGGATATAQAERAGSPFPRPQSGAANAPADNESDGMNQQARATAQRESADGGWLWPPHHSS